ncbi:BrnT family toxin [Tolypothrix sp. PCC 7910]|uniref:BrnT family toxin n=1 Tax=Tolypothrix sp. PCC 7910 TaxID=2099387 RepID=UPI00142778A8|nr:BrnT family toxin [Tolypothrix sp. PCC 7910]QIR36813.1 BrnT family toxin [Tolypothrix sp. PCC 7910]
MKKYEWNTEKNALLLRERKISFERIVLAIEQGYLLDVVPHPNSEKYPHQKMFILEIEGYAYVVPFVENNEKIFLKTAYKSRLATRTYLGT